MNIKAGRVGCMSMSSEAVKDQIPIMDHRALLTDTATSRVKEKGSHLATKVRKVPLL